MRQASPTLSALLEIGRSPSGEIPASLISAAYRASRSTAVMLVLDAVSPAEVDQVLDPIVARNGHDLCGVVYVDKRNQAAVLSGAASASRIFAASDDLRATLASNGIAFQNVDEAESLFATAASA